MMIITLMKMSILMKNFFKTKIKALNYDLRSLMSFANNYDYELFLACLKQFSLLLF